MGLPGSIDEDDFPAPCPPNMVVEDLNESDTRVVPIEGDATYVDDDSTQTTVAIDPAERPEGYTALGWYYKCLNSCPEKLERVCDEQARPNHSALPVRVGCLDQFYKTLAEEGAQAVEEVYTQYRAEKLVPTVQSKPSRHSAMALLRRATLSGGRKKKEEISGGRRVLR